jgi:hypothetical protein
MAKKDTVPSLADITLHDNNILEMYFHKASINLDSAKKITDTASNLSGDVVHANLVDIRDMSFMSGDARKHFGSQDKSTVKAVAIVMQAKLHRPLVNLYLKISSPTIPTKIFDDKTDAENWLLEKLNSGE